MTTATFHNINSMPNDYQRTELYRSQVETVTIKQLGVQYRMVEALKDITCDIQPGRLTGIIGPNGAGKSTLLKAMLGLVPTANGMAL
jgi:manganese/iron transport system ATP-binding protein